MPEGTKKNNAVDKIKKVIHQASRRKTDPSGPYSECNRKSRSAKQEEMSLSCYKSECKAIARQLGYNEEIQDLIDAATSEIGVQQALVTGRNQMIDRGF